MKAVKKGGSPWAKMPSRWIRTGGLAEYGAKSPSGGSDRAWLNRSLACLKTYIAICTRADYYTGVTKTSYDELCTLTDQARAVVGRALRVLEADGLISCYSPNPRSGTTITVCRWNEEKGFAKIPKRWLLTAREAQKEGVGPKGVLIRLRQFRFDSRPSLNALKVYLVLLAERDSGTDPGEGLAIIGYTRIASLADIGRHQVSDAITMLLEMNLITFRTGDYRESEDVDFDRTNRYLVRGLNVRWQSADDEAAGAKLSKKKGKRPSQAEVKATNSFADIKL